MKPYFYVQRVGDRPATVKHPTLESAHKESLRLAGQHPGATFEILQCVGITRTTEPSTFWNDGCDPTAEEYSVDGQWKPNTGDMPCSEGTHVEVSFRDGGLDSGKASRFRWNFIGSDGDIFRWRFVR